MVPHLGFIFVLVKLMQIVWKKNEFLGESFPQDQERELDCERAEVLCEKSEIVFPIYLFFMWSGGPLDMERPPLVFSHPNQSHRACGLQNALLPDVRLVFT